MFLIQLGSGAVTVEPLGETFPIKRLCIALFPGVSQVFVCQHSSMGSKGSMLLFKHSNVRTLLVIQRGPEKCRYSKDRRDEDKTNPNIDCGVSEYTRSCP